MTTPPSLPFGPIDWRDASVLVTGGTGSFGNKLVEVMLRRHRPGGLVVIGRDERKQSEMVGSYR